MNLLLGHATSDGGCGREFTAILGAGELVVFTRGRIRMDARSPTEPVAVRGLPARRKLPFTSRVLHVLAGALAGLVIGCFLRLPPPAPWPRTLLSSAKGSRRSKDHARKYTDGSRADERARTSMLGHDAQTIGMRLEAESRDAETVETDGALTIQPRAPMACVSESLCTQLIAPPSLG
eukprot:scaffold26906_cov101-Isochrysis_galbana.AAC.2